MTQQDPTLAPVQGSRTPEDARLFVLAYLARPPEEQDGALAGSGARLLALQGPDEGRLPGLVFGIRTPEGRQTFEAAVRRADALRAGPKQDLATFRQAVRAGVVPPDPATRPAENLTVIEQGPAGGPSLPASEFRLHALKYPTLNPIQSAVLPWVERDVNLVVSARTSAGKSTIAEMVMAEGLARGGRVLFLSPLRAVSQEKFDDWTAPDHAWTKAGKRAILLTGDYTLTDARKAQLQQADVIVLTTEMFDSRTRRLAHEGGDFLLRAATLVVDESHLLTMESRGDKLEAALMRFTRQVPECRVVFLSATMPNVEQLGAWLTRLNGRPSVVLRSAWRPTELTVHYEPYRDKGRYHEVEQHKRDVAVDLVRVNRQDRIIVFVHSKKAGHQICEDLHGAGFEPEFHSSDLNRDARLDLERRFRDGTTRLIVATSTLAYGVNMPADRVIVLGVHRGLDLVEPLDVVQMCGRAGRVGLAAKGTAHVLVPASRRHEMIATYSEPRDIESRLNGDAELAFHLTAEIAEGNVPTTKAALDWHARSFAALRGDDLPETDQHQTGSTGASLEGLVERLKKAGIVRVQGQLLDPTELGRVSSRLYYSPFDIAAWASAFRRLVERDLTRKDAAIAWALGDVPSGRQDYLPAEAKPDMQAYLAELNLTRVLPAGWVPGPGALAVYGCLVGREPAGMAGRMREWRFDSGRIITAINMLDRAVLGRALQPGYLDMLQVRLQHGCGWLEADLCRLPGIGPKRAAALVQAGISSIAILASRPDTVREVLGSKLADPAIEAARSFSPGP